MTVYDVLLTVVYILIIYLVFKYVIWWIDLHIDNKKGGRR